MTVARVALYDEEIEIAVWTWNASAEDAGPFS
jgi:hypothetical protein